MFTIAPHSLRTRVATSSLGHEAPKVGLGVWLCLSPPFESIVVRDSSWGSRCEGEHDCMTSHEQESKTVMGQQQK